MKIMREGLWIVFSGPDGAGKTTLARLVSIVLRSHCSVYVHWMRGSHLIASFFLRLLSWFGVFYGDCNPYYRVCVPSRLRALWIHLEFWSLLPWLLLRYLLSFFYDIVLCDRGLMDFIVWIISTSRYPRFIRTIYARFLLRLARREYRFVLKASLGVLSSRSDVPFNYLVREIGVYSVLSSVLKSVNVDVEGLDVVRTLIYVLKVLKRSFNVKCLY